MELPIGDSGDLPGDWEGGESIAFQDLCVNARSIDRACKRQNRFTKPKKNPRFLSGRGVSATLILESGDRKQWRKFLVVCWRSECLVDLRRDKMRGNRVDRIGRNPDPPFHFMRIYKSVTLKNISENCIINEPSGIKSNIFKYIYIFIKI